MMMNCFCGMVDRRKAFSLTSSWDHCQRSSPSQISGTPRAGFEPAQNLSSGLVEWSCAVVITTTPRCHIESIAQQKIKLEELLNLFKKYWNSINTIIKVSKAKYYHQYFNINREIYWKFGKELKKLHNVNQVQEELMAPFPLIKTKFPIHLIHFSATFLKRLKKADPSHYQLFLLGI